MNTIYFSLPNKRFKSIISSYTYQTSNHLSRQPSLVHQACISGMTETMKRLLGNHISDKNKHCQKHNGLEGWVLLTKITSFVISKFLHKFWSNFISRISTKHQLQNLNQISAFRLNLNFIILTKPSFRISTKIKLHNLNQASAAKYWPKFSFKILPEL